MVSVIVVDSPYYSTLDEKGSFSIPSVPDGKANLKVWTRGRWASEQEVDTPDEGRADHQGRFSRRKKKPAAASKRQGIHRHVPVEDLVYPDCVGGRRGGRPSRWSRLGPRFESWRRSKGQRLDRAQYAAEQMFKVDAHKWIDRVGSWVAT